MLTLYTDCMPLKPAYIIIFTIVLIVASLGSFFSGQGLAGWYQTLALPSSTPPGWIIGIVWTIIYVLSAISAIIFWNKAPRNEKFWIIVLLFLVNAFLNILWSYLFFSRHLIFTALIEMIFLELTIVGLISLLRVDARNAAYLLFPYFVWVLYATYLTSIIWRLNR